jgi:hypothetical protein
MKKKKGEFYSVLEALDKSEIDDEVGISFKVKDSFRTKANIASQVLKKSVTQICIEALEKAIVDAGLTT